MWKQTQLRGNSTRAQSGCFGRMSFRISTSLLCSGDRHICVAFEPSATSLCVTTSRPNASAVDAFQQDWSKWKSFIHPPVVQLPRILQKVRSDKATALLVAPDWPGQPWYAQIQLMLTGTPYPLPKEKSLLSLPFDQEAVHPQWRSLNLTAWPISGHPTRRQVSLKR